MVVGVALLASPAQASHCGRLCETDFWKTATTQQVEAEIKVGANPNARTIIGRTPFDLAKDNDKLTGTDAWWRLNDAQYD